jgi:cell division inhibitor SepF
MGARDYWDRMLVYFGIAEEVDGHEDEDAWDDEPSPSRRRASAQHAAEPAPGPRSGATQRRAAMARRAGSSGNSVAGVSVVLPRTFNDAQKIADQFKEGRPVIVNLQTTDADLARRLIDFASGMTYGLEGRMQGIADKVFLLTPPDVDVSDEDRAAMLESGFFNQS